MKRAGAAAIRGCQQTLIQAGLKALSELVERNANPKAGLQAASNREIWAGAQRSRPAGVRAPR